MKTLLFVLGGKVDGHVPTAHFALRTEAAIQYYHDHHTNEEIVFLVSGRWTNATETFDETEAEIGKQYILERIPEALVYKEDISVELVGNYAFSKPLIMALKPDTVVVFTSELMLNRNKLLGKKIFAQDFPVHYDVITTDLSDNETLVAKEVDAIALFNKLFTDVNDGDHVTFRDILLYQTPYYFKGIIRDQDFFDAYWDGGYENFLHGRDVRKNI